MAVIGQVIDNKYRILTQIGQGGMSKVYLAQDTHLNKSWAVKEIQKRARDKNNEVVVQSAIAEANLIKQLDHSSIVRIVDIIETPDVIYIVEDYIEGETLSHLLDESGAQPEEMVVEWAKQICEAFEYLHTHTPPIIYRDMKPANVMLKPDGKIKIIDFGIAREYKDQNSQDTVNLGTKGYAAPEQFGGKGQTDARTDIYCLGVTLYHLLTGQNPCEPPYEIYPIRYWNPSLSAGLESIVLKCTQLNPDDRYQSCAELLYALNRYKEYGEEYRAKQKKKLGVFFATVASAVFFAAVGVLGLGMRTATNNADYKTHISQGNNATTSEKKIEEYSLAIQIKPDAVEAYEKVLDAMESDLLFTSGYKDDDNSASEEQLLMNLINPNLEILKERPEYSDLCFRIGELYWYHYDYGQESEDSDNQTTRMKSAITWFEQVEESSKNYTVANLYRQIGEFTRDITIKVEKADDKGAYAPYWQKIKELHDNISGNENELFLFETYRLALYSIENYSRKFKTDGVKKDDLMAVYEEIFKILSKDSKDVGYIEASSTKTVAIKETLLIRLGLNEENGKVEAIEGKTNSVLAAIENAYRE